MALILGCKHLKSASVSSQFCQFFYCHVTKCLYVNFMLLFVFLTMKFNFAYLFVMFLLNKSD